MRRTLASLACLALATTVPLLPAAAQSDASGLSMEAINSAGGSTVGEGARSPAVLKAQVLLDRAGFSPGVIDGVAGNNLRKAVRGFQEANGMPVTGRLDKATWQRLSADNLPAVVRVTVSTDDASGPFAREIPDDPYKQAKMPALPYASVEEMLAEKFHTTPEMLRKLNPGASFGKPGTQIAVPNVREIETARPQTASASAQPSQAPAQQTQSQQPRSQQASARPDGQVQGEQAGKTSLASAKGRPWSAVLNDLSVRSEQPSVTRVVVDKSDKVVRALGEGDRLLAQFPATIGSEHDPLPLGQWEVKGVAQMPTFNYNPELFWEVDDSKAEATLPPGPNNPVGVVWIDLSKEHYGIHGTPEPSTIGYTQSHGCIRLTNWDAAKLAEMVSPGTPAILQE